MASASYREPRPHARSAETRQEKTRGRRRISRKAPDLPHDAVRTGAESDGRLHTGTTTLRGHSGPSMGKGQLGPFAQSSPPGSHWGICGVVEDYSIAGIQLVTGCNRLGPRNRTFNRTRSSFPYGKNDQLFDNQPRRTRSRRRAVVAPERRRMNRGREPDRIRHEWTAFGPGRETCHTGNKKGPR